VGVIEIGDLPGIAMVMIDEDIKILASTLIVTAARNEVRNS